MVVVRDGQATRLAGGRVAPLLENEKKRKRERAEEEDDEREDERFTPAQKKLRALQKKLRHVLELKRACRRGVELDVQQQVSLAPVLALSPHVHAPWPRSERSCVFRSGWAPTLAPTVPSPSPPSPTTPHPGPRALSSPQERLRREPALREQVEAMRRAVELEEKADGADDSDSGSSDGEGGQAEAEEEEEEADGEVGAAAEAEAAQVGGGRPTLAQRRAMKAQRLEKKRRERAALREAERAGGKKVWRPRPKN